MYTHITGTRLCTRCAIVTDDCCHASADHEHGLTTSLALGVASAVARCYDKRG